MIKVVLDTNIYISAILFGGKPDTIIKLAREGDIEVLVSEAILAEIAEVLRKKFDWQSWQVLEVIEEIRGIATFVVPRYTLSVVKEDEADNRVLECAIEGEAQYVVSGDEHRLLPLKQYRGIKIVHPAEFGEIVST